MVWGISDGNDLKSNGILFSQDSHEKRPRMSSVPTAYAGRVHIVDQASLVITNARLSDEGFYTCEIRLLFTTLRKTIELRVVGRWIYLSFQFNPGASVNQFTGDRKVRSYFSKSPMRAQTMKISCLEFDTAYWLGK